MVILIPIIIYMKQKYSYYHLKIFLLSFLLSVKDIPIIIPIIKNIPSIIPIIIYMKQKYSYSYSYYHLHETKIFLLSFKNIPIIIPLIIYMKQK